MPRHITQFFKSAAHGSLYQAPDWSDLVEGNEGRNLVLCATQDGIPRFGATVYKSLIPGTPYFVGTVRRGPVFDRVGDAVRLWSEFEARLHGERAIAVMVFPYWEMAEVQTLRAHLKALGYAPSRRNGDYCYTATIDLSKSLEEIFAGFNRDGRRELRKAARKGLRVRRADGPQDWQVLWELTQETAGKKGIDVPSREKLEAMRGYAAANPRHCVALLGSLQRRPISGAVVLRHGSTVIPEAAGSSSAPIPGLPKFLPVLWESIRWGKETGASRFDVGGLTAATTRGAPLWRINMFKRQLSGREVQLFRPMEKVFHPGWYRAYTLLRTSKQKVLGRYRHIVSRAT